MATMDLQEHKWSYEKGFKPVSVEREKLNRKQISKIELFEAGLKNEISKTDSLDVAMKKVVRMALAAEFGPSFVKTKGAEEMIKTILSGIMTDNPLRKQALFIIDRFAK